MKSIVKTFLIIAVILIVIGMALVVASLFFGAHFSNIWDGTLPVTQFVKYKHSIQISFGDRDRLPNNQYRQDNT